MEVLRLQIKREYIREQSRQSVADFVRGIWTYTGPSGDDAKRTSAFHGGAHLESPF
jgi:hypothetical protein